MESIAFIMFLIGTVVTSSIMNFSLSMQIVKDIADAGYKINSDKFKEYKSELKEQGLNIEMQNSKLITLIPVLNIIYQFEALNKYINSRETLLDSLSVANVIEEMTDEELEAYKKKPTGINAIAISTMSEKKLEEENSKNIMIFAIDLGDNIKGNICIKINDTNDDFIILSATDEMCKFSYDEQKQIVLYCLSEYLESLDNKFRENTNLGETSIDKQEELDTNDIEQEELLRMKQELLDIKKNYSKEEDVKVLKKDKK